MRVIILGFVACIVSACALEPKQLDWSGNQSVKPAVLYGHTAFTIVSVDGNKDRSCYNRVWYLWNGYQTCVISLDPGHHLVTVKYDVAGLVTKEIPLEFDAAPEGRYQLRFDNVRVSWFQDAVRPSIVPFSDDGLPNTTTKIP